MCGSVANVVYDELRASGELSFGLYGITVARRVLAFQRKRQEERLEIMLHDWSRLRAALLVEKQQAGDCGERYDEGRYEAFGYALSLMDEFDKQRTEVKED